MNNDDIRHVAATELARWIRADLKASFPTVRFSVRSHFYSMGSSVTVHWTDGPTKVQVDRVVGKYQRATFDGMDDSTGNLGPFTAPTGETVRASSWIHTERRVSQEWPELGTQ